MKEAEFKGVWQVKEEYKSDKLVIEENRGWNAQKHWHDIHGMKIVGSLGWLENCNGTNCSMYFTHTQN